MMEIGEIKSSGGPAGGLDISSQAIPLASHLLRSPRYDFSSPHAIVITRNPRYGNRTYSSAVRSGGEMRKMEPPPLRTRGSCLVVLAMFVAHAVLWADTQTIATQLAAQLEAHTLDALAAESPNDAGRFVAAIYRGGHILAISAVHPAPAFVRREIAAGNHRHVYSILSTSANLEGRLFVEDFGELGLRLKRGSTGPVDATRRDSARPTMFNGDWRAQELSEAEYHQRFAIDEVEYAEMLHVLAAALERKTAA